MESRNTEIKESNNSNTNEVHLINFSGVNKYKSIFRAFRRGDITSTGVLVPHRPFNCRGNSCIRDGHHSRFINEEKKRIYARIKQSSFVGI